MRSLIFEGKTWEIYEELRQKDKNLHKNLCKLLKEILRDDPTKGTGKPEPLKHNIIYQDYGQEEFLKRIA